MKFGVKSTLGIASLVVLAGCGGGSGDSTPPPASSTPPPSAVSPSPPAPTPPPVAVAPVPTAPVAIGAPVPIVPVVDTKPVDPTPAAPTPEGIPSGATLPTTKTPSGYFYLTTTKLVYVWNDSTGKWDTAVSQPPPPPAPPPPPPEPAPGTFITGKIVKAALRSNPYGDLGNCANYRYYYYSYLDTCDAAAFEVKNGNPSRNNAGVYVGFWIADGDTKFLHYSYPRNYDYNNPNSKYPEGSLTFDIVFPNSIFSLGERVISSSGSGSITLMRDKPFEIKDDLKFLLDTSAATWKGVEGKEQYFVQLQISSFHPSASAPASDFIFKVCLHEYFPASRNLDGKDAFVRRLACTLHNKDTGKYVGTQVLDDSRGLGATEYLPVND